MRKEALLASLKQAKSIIEGEAANVDRNASYPEKSLKALQENGWMGLLVHFFVVSRAGLSSRRFGAWALAHNET